MFTGKNAIVTGGSRGIGRAIALALARHHARVAVFYAGNETAAKETAAFAAEAAERSAQLAAMFPTPRRSNRPAARCRRSGAGSISSSTVPASPAMG